MYTCIYQLCIIGYTPTIPQSQHSYTHFYMIYRYTCMCVHDITKIHVYIYTYTCIPMYNVSVIPALLYKALSY